MRKLVGVLLLLLIILGIASCGQIPNEDMEVFDGVVYNFDESITIEGVNYDAYLPEKFKDNIFYKLERNELESQAENWVINSNYEITYLVDSKFTFSDDFYSYVNSLKENLDKENILYNMYKDKEKIELEFIIDNSEKELIGYGLLIKYVPIKLINNREDIYIMIPITIEVLKIRGDMIESPIDHNFIPYEQFSEDKKLIK